MSEYDLKLGFPSDLLYQMIFLSQVQRLSHPVLVSSGETMAPWVVTAAEG